MPIKNWIHGKGILSGQSTSKQEIQPELQVEHIRKRDEYRLAGNPERFRQNQVAMLKMLQHIKGNNDVIGIILEARQPFFEIALKNARRWNNIRAVILGAVLEVRFESHGTAPQIQKRVGCIMVIDNVSAHGQAP
jgi:hypothetical protein